MDPKPSPLTQPATLPAQIEIFRPGRHIDDSGTPHTFTPADVANMAAAYDPAASEAPLCVGHPADNKPAYGWVNKLAVNPQGTLVMDTHQVAPAFADMVAQNAFKKRSASFYPPAHPSNPKPGNWYLRHVAFLGAQPPAIKGLPDFAEGDARGTVNFSEAFSDAFYDQQHIHHQEQLRMTQELKDQLAQSQAAAAALDAAKTQAIAAAQAAQAELAQFKEAQAKERVAAFTAFCEASHLKATEKPTAVAVLALLGDSKPISFSEGDTTKTVSPVEFVKGLIAQVKPPVQFGEYAPATLQGTAGAGSAQGMSDAEIDHRARAYAAQHKVNYSEALTAVTSFTA